MRTIRCRLAVSALLALVLGDALAMGADVVKIGAIFEDSKEVIFDGTQTWGWAANHAEAAAAAVARINSDDAILPGVELQLVRIHVEALRAAAWLEGTAAGRPSCASCGSFTTRKQEGCAHPSWTA